MIYNFDYKPEPLYFTAKKETIPPILVKNYLRRERGAPFSRSIINQFGKNFHTYGFEIEFESPGRDVTDIVTELMSDIHRAGCYVKHDGSLVNGFEIVTYPRTYASWLEFKDEFSNLLKRMRDSKLRSYTGGRCGLHIHIGLTGFNDITHLIRFCSFFNSNPVFMTMLSGRKDLAWVAKYCGFSSPKDMIINFMMEFSNDVYAFKSALVDMSKTFGEKYEEYHAINSQCQYVNVHHAGINHGKDTVEVRFFRGSLNVKKIYGILEMMEALKSFTLYSQATFPKASDFLEYIKDKQGLNNFKQKLLQDLISKGYNPSLEKISSSKRMIMYIKNQKCIEKMVTTRNATFGLPIGGRR